MDKQPGFNQSTVNQNQKSPVKEEWFVKMFLEKLIYTHVNHEIFQDKFFLLMSEEEQVTMVHKTLKEFDMLPFKSTDKPENRKSATLSASLRTAGNAAFSKGKDCAKAISLYTQSIAAAPYLTSDDDAPGELALAFSNRSAMYLRVGKYEACLRDIAQALELKYPDNLRYKLYERRAECYQKLGRKEDAQASSQGKPGRRKSVITETFKNLHLQDGFGCAVKSLPQKSYGQHPHISSASACVDITYDPDMGRHFIANRNIDPGDILLVEKPFASILHHELATTHCSNCLKRYDALIPCKTCNLAMYCSDECRSGSWLKSHRFECRLNPAMDRLKFYFAFALSLSVRTVLNACSQHYGILGLYHLVKNFEEPNADGDERIRGFGTNGQYNSSDFATVYNLCRHNRRMPHTMVISMCVGAACILNCLEEYSDFFTCASLSHVSQETTAALKMFTAGLLGRFIAMSTSNWLHVNDNGLECTNMDTGWAIYPTLSLLNNSCNPNASCTYHEGHVNATFAVQPIKKGEGIFIAYTSTYAEKPITRRKELLQHYYYFDCKCAACVNNWPTYCQVLVPSLYNETLLCEDCHTKLVDMKLTQFTTTTHVTCSMCRKVYSLAVLEQKLNYILERMKVFLTVADVKRAREFKKELASIVKTLHGYVQSPSPFKMMCQSALHKCVQSSGSITSK